MLSANLHLKKISLASYLIMNIICDIFD